MSDQYDYGYCDHCDKYHDDADHPHRRRNNRLIQDADVRFAFYDVRGAEAVVLNTKENAIGCRDAAIDLCGCIEGEERFL